MKKHSEGIQLTCVAVLYKGVVYVIAAPAEHADVIHYIEQTLGESLDGSQVFGFLDNKDKFIEFNEGIRLAKAMGKYVEG